jgi:integrase
LPKIKTRYWPDGTVRDYGFIADVGRHPDGSRHQQRFRFARLKDAQFELNRLGYQRPRGEYVPRWNGTLNELLDAYLRAATRGKEANTVVSYRDALRIPRERLGRRRAQGIGRDDIEQLVDYALAHGRKRGGAPGSGLSVRSVRLMIQQVSAAYEQAVDDQKLARNPCRRVKVDGKPKRQATTWSAAELLRFLQVSDRDRLAPVWRLLCYGLRRGEACGLTWAKVSLEARTAAIGPTRVMVNGRPVDKPSPKSDNGWRTLPFDAVVAGQLERLQSQQMDEALTAGPAYQGGRQVASDELGRAVSPERLSDEFQRLAAQAGLPRIRMHDLRHTSNTLMATAGVPANVRALWHGHTQAVNVGTYTHARAEDLALAAEALGKIHNPAA